MTLRRLPYHYRSSQEEICIRWEVVSPYWGLQWQCWDLGPASASPALSPAPKAPLSSQAKAVTRLWQLPQTAKMRSSTICAGSSVTYRRECAAKPGSRLGRALAECPRLGQT